MPLTPEENEAVLQNVTDAVRRGDGAEIEKIKATVAETLRRVRGNIKPLNSEESEGLWIIVKEMLDKVKEAAARQAAGKAESDALLEKVRKEEVPSLGGKRRSRSRSRRVTAKRFCGCIKKVKSAKKKRTEGSSIAICTSSLLWPHGRTLHSVSCRRKASIKTQKRKK